MSECSDLSWSNGSANSNDPHRPLSPRSSDEKSARSRSSVSGVSGDSAFTGGWVRAKSGGRSSYVSKSYGGPSDDESDEEEDSQSPKKFELSTPSLGLLAGAAKWVLIGPLIALALLSTGLVVVQGVAVGTSCIWFGVGHLALCVLMMLWMLVRGAARERALLMSLGEAVSQFMTSGENNVSGCLSQDPRIQYVQTCLRKGMAQAATEQEEARLREADPMYFIRKDVKQWDKADTGYTVINETGVILYTNRAMSKFFGYSRDDIIGENVRILMPSPYSGQHDFFLKRHIEMGVRNVIGSERAVPILKADGTQAIVRLAVQEAKDPCGGHSRLFVGVMQFKLEDETLTAFRSAIREGAEDVVEAAKPFEDKPAPIVLMEMDGTIRCINKAGEALLGWSKTELSGKNVKVLMGEPYASNHDAFLRKYQEKAEAAERRGQVPLSNIVGSGRDVVAKHKNGRTIRVFLMVDRVERSGCARDCLFLGSMVCIADSASDTRSSARSSSDSGSRRGSVFGSPRRGSIFSNAPSNHSKSRVPVSPGRVRRMMMQPLDLKKCTVMVADVWGLYQDNSDPKVLTHHYDTLLSHVDAVCAKNKGHLQWLVGDRVVLTFNAAVPNTSHRPSAAHTMLQLQRDINSSALPRTARLYTAAVMRECYVGVGGKQPILIGQAVDLCNALLRIGVEADVTKGLVDSSLYEELQYSFQCRRINIITVHPRTPLTKTSGVYELQDVKEVAVDEWMYQICTDTEKDDPLAVWTKCWECLGDEKAAAAGTVGRYALALEYLATFIESQPTSDNTALWMRRAIQSRWNEGTDFPREPIVSGKLPVLIHYSLMNGVGPAGGDRPHSAINYMTPRGATGKTPTKNAHIATSSMHAVGGFVARQATSRRPVATPASLGDADSPIRRKGDLSILSVS